MIRILTTLTTLLLLSSTAQATVPERMHYQGYLTNADGEAVHCPDAVACPDQSFAITFRLYDSVEGGDPLWVETHLNVPVVRGTFDVVLGADSPLDPADVADPMWLGVEINGAGEMSPRQRLVSAAFAMHAGRAEASDVASLADDADRLGGFDAAEYALLSALPGMCISQEELSEVLAAYLDLEALALYLTDEGYVTGPHFSGQFSELAGVPAALQELSLTEDGSLTFGDTVIINAAGEWVGSPTGLQGAPGEDGAPGEAGEDGAPGEDGVTGVGVASVDVNAAGELVVTLTNDVVFTSASLIGEQGEPGGQGEPGEQGIEGDVGPAGDPGDDGALAGLTCPDGDLVKMVGGAWACAPDAGAGVVAPWSETSGGVYVLGARVGIGTSSPATDLEVAGGVKLGDTDTCDAATAGTMRWTGAAFEGCDGASWVALSTGSAAPPASVLYIESNSSTPPACPSGWSDGPVDVEFLEGYYNYRRICHTSQVCSVLYVRSNSSNPAACPTGWTSQAVGVRFFVGYYNYKRVCTLCN